MKKFIAILVLSLLLSNASLAARYDPLAMNVTWWDRTVCFFEDLFSFESENDKKIKQLENRIKQLERKSNNSNSGVEEMLRIQMLIEALGD